MTSGSDTTYTQLNQEQSFWTYVKRQFRKNKLALFSSYFVLFLFIIALLADFLANEKPIVAKYKGDTIFPIIRSYGVSLGLTKWPKHLNNVNWHKLEYDYVIYPLIPYSPTNQDVLNSRYVAPNDKQDVTSKRWWHWFGTDQLGHDILSCIIHGTRIAFLVAIVSMTLSTLIGVILGGLAGYFGDERLQLPWISVLLYLVFFLIGGFFAFGARSYIFTDALAVGIGRFLIELFISFIILSLFMVAAMLLSKVLSKIPLLKKNINVPIDLMVSRLIEIIVCVPRLFLIVSIVAIVKPSIFWVMVIIGLTSWTGIARFIRSELLRVRNLEYVEAAQALGFSNWRIMFKHAIPNSLSPVLIDIAFGIAAAILIEASLSFLGIGMPSEIFTWGRLLSMAREQPSAWWIAIFPGMMIFFTVTVFNLIGEGLTDALDPRLKK